MTQPIVINREAHEHAGYTSLTDYQFAAKTNLVPVVGAELPSVMQHMALAFQQFVSAGQTRYILVAIQSFEPKHNLFVHPDGQWLLGYKPAYYREFPFTLLAAEQPNQLQLAIHQDWFRSSLDKADQAFYKNGNLTEHMNTVVKFLSETMKSRLATMAHCRSLQEAGVIQPWAIRFNASDEKGAAQSRELTGLFHIDIKALQALPAEQLASLSRTGALDVAYAQRLSEARLKDLSHLQEAHQRLLEQAKTKDKPVTEINFDNLYGESDDLFSF